MPVVGITGGVATGKSTVAQAIANKLLESERSVASFSADDAAHFLLESDRDILRQIDSVFGDSVFAPTGAIDRARLRDVVFSNPEQRRRLEAILHPAIRDIWTTRSAVCRNTRNFYIAEIPLLYETQAETWCDSVIVVAASDHRQVERLVSQRGWSAQTAASVIDVQMPQTDKMTRADIMIWNDFTDKVLQRQIGMGAAYLMSRYV